MDIFERVRVPDLMVTNTLKGSVTYFQFQLQIPLVVCFIVPWLMK